MVAHQSFVLVVLAAIELYDKTRRRAVEVDYVRTERMLATKLTPIEATTSQRVLDSCLCIRHFDVQ